MITKERIREKKERINAELNSLYSELEHLWEWARNAGFHGLANAADNAQHWGACVSQVKSDVMFLIEDLYDIVEENEKIKDLPKLLDFQKAFDQIQSTVKRWDERLYPEDYPSK